MGQMVPGRALEILQAGKTRTLALTLTLDCHFKGRDWGRQRNASHCSTMQSTAFIFSNSSMSIRET